MHTRTAGRLVYVAATLVCAVLQPVAAAEDSGKGLQQWRRLAIDRAVTTANAISDPYRRAEAFTGIARAQVVADDTRAAEAAIRSALAAAGQVAERAFRGWALHDIVQAQIAADDPIGATQTADRIETDRPRGAALAIIAGMQLRGGNLTAAQATAAKIRNDASQSEVLRQIVAVQAASDALPSARETLRRIDDAFYLAYALGDVAVAEVRHGNIKAAEALAVRARRNYRSLVYGRIALARVDAGDVRGGLDTLARIDDPLYRAVVQGRVASARAAAGNTAEAQQLFAAALSALEAVPDESHRKAVTFSQLARMQATSGDRSGARETLQRALAISSGLKPGEERDDALDLIARGQARAGNADAAMATASLVTDRIARALLIRDVVTVRTEQDEAPAASIAGFDDPLMQTAALFGQLGAQLTKSNLSVSAATIDAAHAAVRSISEAELKPAAFAALASARIASGDSDGGWSIFQEALAAAEAMAREDQRATAYTRIVDALNERLLFLGQPVRGEPSPASLPSPLGEGR
jgi:tetratricopeptide (TPR) repeat protein